MTMQEERLYPVRWGALAAFALTLLASCGGGGTAGAISQARLASDEGHFREAIILLRNAVAKDPASAEARYRLGEAALGLGDAETAEKELLRARELAFDEKAIVPLLAQALLLRGRPVKALKELAAAPEQTARVLGLTGLAYEAKGEDEQAISTYRQALALDPVEERALLGMARSSLAQADRESARRSYELAAAEHGDSPGVRLDYGRFLYRLGKAADAAAQYEAALALPILEEHLPMRWELSLALAEAQLAQGKVDEADQTIGVLNEMQPDHMLIKYLRARTAFERKDLVQASDLVGRVVVEAPTFQAGQILQATIHLAQKEFTPARLLLERLAKIDPTDAQVRTLLAAARRGDELDGASAGLSLEALEQDVVALLGSANASSGDYRAAMALWERVLQENPDDEETRLDLIGAYLLNRRLDDAASQLDAVQQWRDPANEARAAVLGTLLSVQRDAPDVARGNAAASAARFPDSAPIANLRGIIEIEGNPSLASSFFQQALTLDPAYTSAAINLANLLEAEGNAAQALELMSAFVQRQADDARALDALARAQLRSGDTTRAIESFQRARAADPDAMAPRLALIDLLSKANDYVVAEDVAREMVAARPQLPQAHNSLGVALIGQGKLDDGMASLRAALRLDQTAIEPLRNLARAEYASSKLAQARRSVEQLLRRQPNDTVALDLATRVAIDEGRADEAEVFLDRLNNLEAAGTESLRLVLAGDLAMLRGRYEQAVGAYEAVFADRQSTTLVMRLYKARQRRGDEQPQQVLREWLTSHPDDYTVLLAAATHAHGAGDLVQATADYEQLLRLNRASAAVWNNLAWAYSDLGDFRALEASARALELASSSPTIQDTYGWMLILDDQLDNGISMLREAWEAAPDAGEIGYHLAAGLAQAGQRDEARTVLTQALAKGGEFAARGDAERLMGEL